MKLGLIMKEYSQYNSQYNVMLRDILILIIFGVMGWFSTTGVKSQLVRLGDVFVYGPLLIWIGYEIKEPWKQFVLYLMGSSTITYNLRNYLAQR